jgi:hypothetical protein
MPPPSAPAEIICISIRPGKTSAMPASASAPSRYRIAAAWQTLRIYIELDGDSPTPSGGRGAFRNELAAAGHKREGTCVCVEDKPDSLGAAAAGVARPSFASLATAALPAGARAGSCPGEAVAL